MAASNGNDQHTPMMRGCKYPIHQLVTMGTDKNPYQNLRYGQCAGLRVLDEGGERCQCKASERCCLSAIC